MSNKFYNIMKGIALVYLPALGTLYYAMAGLWGIPYAEEVVGTIVAIDTFLGVVLHISSGNYKPPLDGKLIVDESDPDKTIANFDLTTSPKDLISRDLITVKVVHPEIPPPPAVRVLPPSA
jgi:Putative phage holin Dp-1